MTLFLLLLPLLLSFSPSPSSIVNINISSDTQYHRSTKMPKTSLFNSSKFLAGITGLIFVASFTSSPTTTPPPPVTLTYPTTSDDTVRHVTNGMPPPCSSLFFYFRTVINNLFTDWLCDITSKPADSSAQTLTAALLPGTDHNSYVNCSILF